MKLKLVEDSKDRPVSAVEKLVDIADAMFDRSVSVESLIAGKLGDEKRESAFIALREEILTGVVELWRVIIEMAPTAAIDPNRRKELTMDGYKVISRCCHLAGDLEGAQKAITRAIDLGYFEGFISLGAICLDQDDYDGAKNAFESAIGKNVETMRAHAGLGELYFRMGAAKLKNDPEHTEYFHKSEEEFVLAGKERFTEAYERAMDLFEAIGWKERAKSIGERAIQYYDEHRAEYADRLRSIDMRIRQLAGEERHERIVSGVSRKLGDLLGGKWKDTGRS